MLGAGRSRKRNRTADSATPSPWASSFLKVTGVTRKRGLSAQGSRSGCPSYQLCDPGRVPGLCAPTSSSVKRGDTPCTGGSYTEDRTGFSTPSARCGTHGHMGRPAAVRGRGPGPVLALHQLTAAPSPAWWGCEDCPTCLHGWCEIIEARRPDTSPRLNCRVALCTPLPSPRFAQVARLQNSQLQERCLALEAEPVRGLGGSFRLSGRQF